MEKNKKFQILLITTGGTIDKIYDEGDGSLQNRQNSVIEDLVSSLRHPHTQIDIKFLMSKDSLQMTDEDRVLITKAVQENFYRQCPIIVIHGTDTMEQSALHCHEHLKNPSVPVIFTGAMRPPEFSDTDAKQNVTEALMAATLADPGVYISFHGKLFALPKVRKNHQIKTFEAY